MYESKFHVIKIVHCNITIITKFISLNYGFCNTIDETSVRKTRDVCHSYGKLSDEM